MSKLFLNDIFIKNKDDEAIIWNKSTFSYHDLLNKIEESRNHIKSFDLKQGSVIALEGDFSPYSIALLIALIENNCIIVPLSNQSIKNESKLFEISHVEAIFRIDKSDSIKFEKISKNSKNNYYDTIRQRNNPGLVLFTSGTSGEPKAAVHDFSLLLNKFKKRRTALRTLNFLLFDHWGGLNTMFHILSNCGVVIATKNRKPENVCKLIEKYKIELLPTSPTFLNLLIISEVYKSYDLTSLKIISYGTEPMPKNTLDKLKILFPRVKLLQTYGLIELGVMKSKSEKNDSLWVKIGGEGYQTRIVDGMLEIKAKSAMLGYLNAPSPFTNDGWFKTGDSVRVKGEYLKILGRKSELINVGGEKVYPQEVENIIQQMENIAEVTVHGEKNPIVGNIVCATVRLLNDENKKDLFKRLKKYCSNKLANYKVPVKINIEDKKHYNERFKKVRDLG